MSNTICLWGILGEKPDLQWLVRLSEYERMCTKPCLVELSGLLRPKVFFFLNCRSKLNCDVCRQWTIRNGRHVFRSHYTQSFLSQSSFDMSTADDGCSELTRLLRRDAINTQCCLAQELSVERPAECSREKKKIRRSTSLLTEVVMHSFVITCRVQAWLW